MNDRLFPTRPILAVSAAVFRDDRALVIRRARAPLLGHFSLPGGGVEVGETLAAALARELMEEVGIEAEIIAFNRHVEAISPRGPEYSRILSSLRSSPDG
jgi:8-oxo-dGTP diphosphatase